MLSLAGLEVANPILTVESVFQYFYAGIQVIIQCLYASRNTALVVSTSDWPMRRKRGSAFCKQIYFIFHDGFDDLL